VNIQYLSSEDRVRRVGLFFCVDKHGWRSILQRDNFSFPEITQIRLKYDFTAYGAETEIHFC